MTSTARFDNWQNRLGTQAGSIDASGNVTFDNDVSITGEFTSRGYRYVQTLYFTSSGTFTKATYPWLRAIRVRLVGGGGGSAGVNASNYHGGSGAGGGYAESFITDIVSLSASETVTVGAGGSAGATGANAGGAGGTSSFGTLVVATGGGGGTTELSTSAAVGGSGTAGDLQIAGQGGSLPCQNNFGSTAILTFGGTGGSSVLGGGGAMAKNTIQGGKPPQGFGGGAGASLRIGFAAFQGSSGRLGIVIVELYA